MPARRDIRSILLIGSGPIIIGQACEFDYSGTQAAKVLRSHGYRVVLVNSNPATIMTDPEFADATYIEPITPEVVTEIIAREQPDALLPTLGGQTALNLATTLARSGVLERHGVEMIGAGLEVIERAEDRGRFKETMEAVGLEVPRAGYARSMGEAVKIANEIGFPVMVRPSFILGGGGTGIAQDEESFIEVARNGLATSPVGEILVEESVYGWKEFELEVMRDRNDNAVIVCSIENLDPMGVHTGDSLTVAPIQTLSDREYQEMRDDGIAVLRAIGVETGGSNVQFAVDPATGRRLVIEMNPRVSRSSALASKATGFPIAKIAALLAVGFTLDEIANDITGATPASFEPALDYVVVKAPRFDFDKFPSAPTRLGTSMRSVGEAMAIGRTFPEALQKALRSLENGRAGLNADPAEESLTSLGDAELESMIETPSPTRIYAVGEALRRGWTVERVAAASFIDPWFIDQIAEIYEVRADVEKAGPTDIDRLREAKRYGFSDRQLAHLWGIDEAEVRSIRLEAGITRTYKTVDTCAAEFEAVTPYMYGTFEEESEVPPSSRDRVVVLGSGPNRIGQGIEFDYCCVHASFALGEAGYETVMVNCNPETVSTDYDTSDRLYFEPLTIEDVLEVIAAEQPVAVVVQLGGQTPLNLAAGLFEAGVPIAGTSPASIALAEDREQFAELCRGLGLRQPPAGSASSVAEAIDVVDQVGLPVMVRPSFVLGGRGMRVIYSVEELADYVREIYGEGNPELTGAPILIDRFLEAAVEVDVDAVYDGSELLLGGVMEHVEEAGVHSGDSDCVTPPPTISDEAHKEILNATRELSSALDVRGLINLQFAVKGDEVYLLEANPRGSRTVPFISKATAVPLARIAARVMMGSTIEELRREGVVPLSYERPNFVAVKNAVLPWDRFPEEDSVLGPEMKATGEVMGIGSDVGVAFAKALLGAGHVLPTRGRVFLSFADKDKPMGLAVAQAFTMLGFDVLATRGTARYLRHHAIDAEAVNKVGEGPRDIGERLENGEVQLVINTPRGEGPFRWADDPKGGPGPLRPMCDHDPGRPGGRPQPAGRLGGNKQAEEPSGMAPVGLNVDLGRLRLRSPLIAASGTVGSVWEWADVADVAPYGAAVAKSVSPVAWPGQEAPRLAPGGVGMLNGIGIQNPGIEHWAEAMAPIMSDLGVPVWGSAVGSTVDDFALVAKGLIAAGVEAVEVNLSCPNLEDGRMFALDADRAGEVVAGARSAVDSMIGAKLSPNADRIVDVARACVAAGADFLTLTNTAFGFGVSVDERRPLLSGGVGGYSGPGLKPISMRCVYEVASAMPGVPIVGCGGVVSGRDVVEYLMAGASAVALGTVHFAEPKAGARIGRELAQEMGRLGVTEVSDLVGAVRPW